jgi:hypothetical protein
MGKRTIGVFGAFDPGCPNDYGVDDHTPVHQLHVLATICGAGRL